MRGGEPEFVVLRSAFCWRMKPVDGEGHETVAALADVGRMVNSGVPGVCTAMRDQNPPVSEKFPPVIGCAWASGWPMVPLTVKTPPVLVPPPPSTLNQSREKF